MGTVHCGTITIMKILTILLLTSFFAFAAVAASGPPIQSTRATTNKEVGGAINLRGVEFTNFAGTMTSLTVSGTAKIQWTNAVSLVFTNPTTARSFFVDSNGFAYATPITWALGNTNTAPAGDYNVTLANSFSITNTTLAEGQYFTAAITNGLATATNVSVTTGRSLNGVTSTNLAVGKIAYISMEKRHGRNLFTITVEP